MNLVHDYIISLGNLYGIVHREKVLEIYNQQNTNPIGLKTIGQIDSEKLRDSFIFVEGSYFVHEAIIYFKDIDAELRKRTGKPYYIPPKNELLKYKDEFYFEKTREYLAFLRYVTKRFMKGNRKRAIEICEDIQLICQDDFTPSQVFNRLNQLNIVFDNKDQVEAVLNLVMNVANNTRLWENNGFTPNELVDKQKKPVSTNNISTTVNKDESPVLTKQRKIGRNDPCPCGSGKKFKKCCME